jgi:hypothetical protein
LFQVQVVAESYPPGNQVFRLWQRVKMGKTVVGLAFRWRQQPVCHHKGVCREEEAEEGQLYHSGH